MKTTILKWVRWICSAPFWLFGVAGFIASPATGIVSLIIAFFIAPTGSAFSAKIRGYQNTKSVRSAANEAAVQLRDVQQKVLEAQKELDKYTTEIKKLKQESTRLLNSNAQTKDILRHGFLSEVDQMNGIEFERFCGKMLASAGFKNVEVTSASGDQGLDVVGTLHGSKIGVQCKNYSKPVGNRAVQEAISGQVYYETVSVAVITNNSFTPEAVRLAEKAHVALIDRTKLGDLLIANRYEKDIPNIFQAS